ncbi:c-type cytochrome biogenesis protein CcsB [Desulfoglaeba alkanexedens]|jgi:cytochrome c-type biogenesis protein CcsB|uniref:Heme exporter protein C n=1 Tax=Desulfoglaeba alkanexedens ALDC TaxID=980445 RepID=A0A4P8L5P3_9BACT|nr:c-type cytochrome biogenesis protein CcsB [Desulfoglaeba alkanexedens]QCQ23309.1 c-type cytochrome biogenesis protein CcsB [Desulfoglaeba alkanexedens ALDC]
MTSSFLLSLTTFAYLVCSLCYLAGVTFRFRPFLLCGTATGAFTLVIHSAGMLLRWKESYDLGFGHAPLSNLYESLVFGAWSIMLVYFLLERRSKQRALGVIPSVLAFLAMAYASFSPEIDSRIQPLIPALKSNWLIAHVITCFLGYAAFAVSLGISVVYLLKKKDNPGHGSSGVLGMFPTSRQLDELNYQMILFGFLWLSVGILTGSVWANSAWGSYWSWDPKETWSLITWLIYAAVLHVRAVRRWRGRKVAWLSMLGFASVLFTYFGVNFLLSGLHSYAVK